MPQRSFKSMFVELVSFLTLFALIGSMSSNFWERYLIQTELSKMKTSLHMMKETVFNIGTAYDNLQRDLKEIAETKEKKSYNSNLKDSKMPQQCDHRSSMKCIKEEIELSRMKDNDNVKHVVMQNATTVPRNPLKSTAVNSGREYINLPQIIYEQNSSDQPSSVHSHIHKCCKNSKCCNFYI